MLPKKQDLLSHILIYGYGFDVWYTAYFLKTHLKQAFQDSLLKITVWEEEEKDALSWQELNDRLDTDLLEEPLITSLMQKCLGSLHMGRCWKGFKENKQDFWQIHPKNLQEELILEQLKQFWIKERLLNLHQRKYDASCFTYLPFIQSNSSPKHFKTPYQSAAFSLFPILDTQGLAQFFKQKCLEDGVQGVKDDLKKVTQTKDGIHSLHGKKTKQIHADFYIDLSKSATLIEEHLQVIFKEEKDRFHCNHCLNIKIPLSLTNHQSHQNYSLYQTLPSGWAEVVTLYNTLYLSYYFSPYHQNKQGALEEVDRYLKINTSKGGDWQIKHLRIGQRKHAWKANCLSLGKTAFFLEPLGIKSWEILHTSLHFFLQSFPFNGNNQVKMQCYNETIHRLYQNICDFNLATYHLCKREDSSFWKGKKQWELTHSLSSTLKMWKHHYGKLFFHLNHPYDRIRPFDYDSLLLGLEILPLSWDPLDDLPKEFNKSKAYFDSERKRFENLKTVYPPLDDLLMSIHAGSLLLPSEQSSLTEF